MRITQEYLFTKRYHLLVLPEIIKTGDTLTDEELKSPSNRIKFFEHVERFMLKGSPYRYQMGRVLNFYVQLAPILNKIDTMLGWILSKIDASTSNEAIEEHHSIFMRACNFFHRITRELTIGEWKQKSDQDIHPSYIDHLVHFLKYTQEPLYILRLSTLVARFARKFMRTSDKEEFYKPFFDFLYYGRPFFKLISTESFLVKAVIDRVDKVTKDSFKAGDWKEYTHNLQSKVSEIEVNKYLDEPHHHIDLKISTWGEGDDTKTLRLAGEAALLKILSSGRNTVSFEVATICSSVFLLHGGLIWSQVNQKPNYLQTKEGITMSDSILGALNFRPFLDRIVKDLEKLKESPDSFSALEAKILIQSVGLFIYMSHKSMTILAETNKYSDEYYYSNFINDMFLSIGGDPNASSGPEYAKSKYNDLNQLLDHLSFLPPEGDLSSRLSYLDNFDKLGVHHLALEAFGNLQRLVKVLREKNSYRGDPYWFNSLNPLVKKRLEDFELDSYFSTQLPDYNLHVQIIATRRQDQSNGQLSTQLSSWASERSIQNLEKVVKGGLLDTLLKESPRKAYAKDQLVNYYLGWHILWFQSFYDAADSHDCSVWMDPDYVNRDKLKQTMKQEYIVKVFNVEGQEAFDPLKKQLIGFLFFLGLTYLFDLGCYEQAGDSEENQNTIGKLLSFYFDFQMVDFNFLYRLNVYLKDYGTYPLGKTLTESTFIKQTQLFDLWLGDKLFECDSGPAITTGNRRYPSQNYYTQWYPIPVLSPPFDVDPYFSQNYNYDSDKYDENKTPGLIL